MKRPRDLPLKLSFSMLILAAACSAPAAEADSRASMWVDLYRGEPIAYDAILADLAGARVVYLGERHTLKRHHELQARIITDLGKAGVPLVLGLEQMEAPQQPALDKYWKGKIDFDQLAQKTGWATRWRSYNQYRPVLEAARKAGAPILALNARQETIRAVARSGGIDKLDPELRQELPDKIETNDPTYVMLLNIYMKVHKAATPERMRPMFEAQMSRDEMMASVLCEFLKSKPGKGRTAIVVCGAGHVNYGLGTAARVRRRMPGVKDRILLFSESGDVVLAPAMKAASRSITVTHQDLRAIDQPIADYLHVKDLKRTPTPE